jgi:hypothetical protein
MRKLQTQELHLSSESCSSHDVRFPQTSCFGGQTAPLLLIRWRRIEYAGLEVEQSLDGREAELVELGKKDRVERLREDEDGAGEGDGQENRCGKEKIALSC